MDCRGFDIADARMPPFSIRTGEMVNLLLPEHWDETELVKLLTGASRHPNISLMSTVTLANELTSIPSHRLSFFGRWRKQRTFNRPLMTYLQRKGLKETEINEAMRKTKMDLSLPLNCLSGNGRLRLSVMVALRNATLVIFADAAVDYEGQMGVFDDVIEALPNHGAIHLCYPAYRGFSSTPIPRAERIPPHVQFTNEIAITLAPTTGGD